MTVLYISYDGLTDPLGQSQILPYLSGLADKGFKIHILSAEKASNFKKRNEAISNICLHKQIKWNYIFYRKKPPVFSTIFDLLEMRKVAADIVQRENVALVHCRSYLSMLLGLHLKKKYGIKLLFDMRGFWADERVDGTIWSLSNPAYGFIYKWFKQKEKLFLSDADHIISLTENGKETIIHEINPQITASKITVIPCCADLDLFDYQQSHIKNTTTQISDNTFVLAYLGSIGTWYMLAEMLDFFVVLKKLKPESLFLFISNENEKLILNAATKKGLSPDSIIVQSASYQEVPNYIQLANASIFFIKPLFSKRASSPVKHAELMGMGIPVVCNAHIGDTDKIMQNEDLGVLITTFDETSYQKAANTLLEKTYSKEKIRTCAIENYSLANGVNSYFHVYNILMNN